jgi:cell filamentation protein
MSVDDKYTYPGSGGVLVNLLDIRDPERLDKALRLFASRGLALIQADRPARLDFEYLRSIHHRMFGDILAWAGQIRDVDAQAVGTGIPYARPEFIQPALDALFARLAAEDYLAGLDRLEFVRKLANRWADLTATHPFRDGNTRAQSAFVSRLAFRADHPIYWSRVDIDSLKVARIAAVAGDETPLADYLDEVTAPPGPRLVR